MYMVNQDQYIILQKISNPSAQVIPAPNEKVSDLPQLLNPAVAHTSTTSAPSIERFPIAHTSATSITSEAQYSCAICNKSFTKRLNLKYHKRIHKEPACEIDNREFDHPNILAHHMKKQHVDGYKCNICGEIKKSQSELKKHLKTHIKPKKVKNLLIINPKKWKKL